MFAKLSASHKATRTSSRTPAAASAGRKSMPTIKVPRRHAADENRQPVFRTDRMFYPTPGLVPYDCLPNHGLGRFQEWAIEPGVREDVTFGPENGVRFFRYDGGPITDLEPGEYAERESKYIVMFGEHGVFILKETLAQDNERGMGTHSNLARRGFGGELWLLKDGTVIFNACSSRAPVQLPREYDANKKIWKLPEPGTPDRDEVEARYAKMGKLLANMQRADVLQVPLGQRWGSVTPRLVKYTPLLAAPAASIAQTLQQGL
ncbi:MAG: hypothetical protein JWP36_256 [Paucimonas sp.]|nr:hypothetical protein [Paucimonas sp.]